MRIFFYVAVLAVMVVNGLTDAPNAIATCVASRSLSPTRAIFMAGIMNFLGAVTMSIISPRVAETVYKMVELPIEPKRRILVLSAGMCAVVLWSLLAFLFGIPTSESHALVSGLTGAAIAASMSFSVVNPYEWGLIFIGLGASSLPTFFISKYAYRICLELSSGVDRRRAIGHFSRAQRISAAWSAFMHGAQDSQKFLGVLMLGSCLGAHQGDFNIPPYLVLISASAMTFGTLIGGKRIIKKVGSAMTRLDAAGGTCADISSSLAMSVSSLIGLPVSTTHAKTSAMMGVGSEMGRFDRSVAREIVLAWLITFPVCTLIGFLLGLFFLR